MVFLLTDVIWAGFWLLESAEKGKRLKEAKNGNGQHRSTKRKIILNKI